MDETNAVEAVTDEIRLQRALAVVEHQVTHGSTVRQACEACSLPERTFYRWVGEGLLTDWLDECQQTRRTASAAMAAEALPDVMKFMIELASGKKTIRGANPIAAAEFVFSAARAHGETSAAEVPTRAPSVLAFIPEMVTFRIVGGVPVVGDSGIEIIEGTAVELPEDDDNS